MSTILLSNAYSGTPLEILKEAIGDDFDLVVLDQLSEDELKAKIKDADYLLVSGRMKITGDVLSCAGKLRMVQRTGVGLDNMDLDYMREHGIPLYVNQGVNSTSVAEHAVYLILAALRRSYSVNKQIRGGVWKKQQTGLTTHELCGKTVGIVGMGNIGSKVAAILKAFGANLIYNSIPILSPEEEEHYGVAYRTLDNLLAEADIVTLHCPPDPSGFLISRERIFSMKDGAVLVNTARGALVDMSALVDALEAGKLSGVGIDVFDVEPIPADHPILGFDQAVLSPHIGGVTYEAFRSMMERAVNNIRSFESSDFESILACKIL